MSGARPRKAVQRLAVALWNIKREELQTGESGPAFFNYADGAGEPMPFHKQGAAFKMAWWRRARRVLRAVRRAARSETT